jgi:hypothetical protein
MTFIEYGWMEYSGDTSADLKDGSYERKKRLLFFDIFALVKPFFLDDRPPCASPAPAGAGALVIPRYYLTNPTLLCTGNTAQS